MQYGYDHREQIPVYANGLKDIPEAFKRHHWMVPVKFDQLLKFQLKVRMCCHKCEEKVREEIWEVPGVFDVQVTRPTKVIVVAMPNPFGLDENEVLRKAKKIDCRAKFVKLEEIRTTPPKLPNPKPQTGTTHGGKPQGAETNVVQQGGNPMAAVPFYLSSYSHEAPWPGAVWDHSKPPHQEASEYCFHLLLLALLVSTLVYAFK